MSGQNQFLLYTAPDGAVKVEVFFKDETVWLTQKALAELFGVQRPAVTKHLLNIFTSGELAEDSVCSILEHTAADGKTYSAKYYNLDAIIAVGYRVNSYQATRFRIWATSRGGIRGLPPTAGRGVHLGFRPGDQTHRRQAIMSLHEFIVRESSVVYATQLVLKQAEFSTAN
jgi:hypothetical protein